MKKLVMMKGLPGSGKSTFAKELIKDKKDWIRLNNDDLSTMLFGSSFATDQFSVIDSTRKLLIKHFMEKGVNIVVDNTNLSLKHEEYLKTLVETHNAEAPNKTPIPSLYEFSIHDLTNVSLKTCLERNNLRPNPVPTSVILDMYRTSIEPKKKKLEQNEQLPPAIIVDIDGTVARLNGRQPFAMKACINDLPAISVINLVEMYQSNGHKIIFVTGRNEPYRQMTVDWLNKHTKLKQDYDLHMRPANSKEPDVSFKLAVFTEKIQPNYYVKLVLEDRDRMVEMYRNVLGLTCLQVEDGSF